MSRNRNDFITLVQTYVLRPAGGGRVDVLAEAMKIPDDAIPDNVEEAARSFWHWKTYAGACDPKRKPKWLIEHEENVPTEVIAVNIVVFKDRINDDEWWRNAEAVGLDGCPTPCRPLFANPLNSVQVNKPTADAFLAWCESIPGYGAHPDGPPFFIGSIDTA